MYLQSTCIPEYYDGGTTVCKFGHSKQGNHCDSLKSLRKQIEIAETVCAHVNVTIRLMVDCLSACQNILVMKNSQFLRILNILNNYV